jgi:hypothetical protein
VEKCNFYMTKRVSNVSSDLTANRQFSHASSNKRHWCSHSSSLVKEDHAVIGNRSLLSCDGDLAKCMFPIKEYLAGLKR